MASKRKRPVKRKPSASKKSEAARRGWATRRARQKEAAEKRRRAAQKGWETRREKQFAKTRREKRILEAGGTTGWVRWYNPRMKRWILYAERPLKSKYGASGAKQESLRESKALFQDVRKQFPAEMWSGGYKAKISTRDDERGKPIWESEVTRQASSFRKSWDKALRETRSRLKAFYETGRHKDAAQHYYRIWIVAVQLHAAGPRNERGP